VPTLICRYCKLSNVKSLGPNVQCFDCGRLSETHVYAHEPEVEADQTPEEAEEAAALASQIEAEEKAAAAKTAAKKPKS
jgi:hypothetical protein